MRECRSGALYELAADLGCSMSFCDWDAGLNGMRWTIQKSLPRQGKKLKVAGDTLTLLRVTPEDAGVYVCTATNQQSRSISSLNTCIIIWCRILNGKMWILSQTSESEDLCLCGAPTPGSVGGDGRTGTHKPWHLGIGKAQYYPKAVCDWIHMTIQMHFWPDFIYIMT